LFKILKKLQNEHEAKASSLILNKSELFLVHTSLRTWTFLQPSFSLLMLEF